MGSTDYYGNTCYMGSEQEVGKGKSEEAEGKKLESDELCGLQWWG